MVPSVRISASFMVIRSEKPLSSAFLLARAAGFSCSSTPTTCTVSCRAQRTMGMPPMPQPSSRTSALFLIFEKFARSTPSVPNLKQVLSWRRVASPMPKDSTVSMPFYRFGFTMSRQSRSPLFTPRMSISAVATLVATGILCTSQRRKSA